MNQTLPLPKHVDVAIIGGGITGIATAYHLSAQGASVAVFEKGTLACEQSSRNWGWVRTLLRDVVEVPLAVRAGTLWRDLQSKIDVGFRASGILYLAKSRQDMHAYSQWLARAGLTDARMLDADAARAMLPLTSVDWEGALYSPSDGVAEPGIATRAIAELARRKGCCIHEHCAVRGLQSSGSRVTGVWTEHGPVQAGAVLLAGGAWSRLFSGNLGIELPQLKVRASVLRATAPSTPMDVTVNGKDFTCRREADGNYVVSQFNASYADIVPDSLRLLRHYLPSWLGNNGLVKLRFGHEFFRALRVPRRFDTQAVTPFEQQRMLNPSPAPATASALTKLQHAFPAFRDSRILDMWSGYIDVMPDALPVMDHVDACPGLYIATGFSGHGFGIGPAVGEAMAQLIDQRMPSVDLGPFSLSRFS
ncbi:MAG: D-amino-acid oxidase [Polaromonas sp.]|jgi:glycine/D-amino acid oxidase-like deaminating enzyme|nr:D-amino-acid oxidase [Polaromonas sp.]MDB5940210.1 D-amino-acid oxidase [Polaromonas sp.]